MKKTLIALTILAAVCPVFGQEEPEGPPPGIVAAHNHVVSFLQLSEEQVAAWDEIYAIHRDAERPLREEMHALEAELGEMIAAGDADPAAVGDLVLSIAGLRDQLHEIQRIYNEDFIALLDEEQEQKLGFIARADRVQPLIPAFKLFELIPPR